MDGTNNLQHVQATYEYKHTEKNKLKIVFTLCIVGCLGYMYMYSSTKENTLRNMLIQKYQRLLNATSYQNISDILSFIGATNRKQYTLLWYEKASWVEKKDPFPIKNCDYTNCKVNFDKTKLSDADLVLFDHDHLRIQPKKIKHQIWVIFSFEPEPYTDFYDKSRRWENAFDWTMGFRKDCDGYGPYGKIIPTNINKYRNYSDIFRGKHKDAVIFSSHCDTASKRGEYIQQMQKYINVDIYGTCGNNTCKDGGCKSRMLDLYKFYLAFENSICFDYTTEKAFNVYSNNWNVIPVVRGAPNIRDILPKDTFIATLDFNSPKALALYMKRIASNETLFTKLLRQKHKFTKVGKSMYLEAMCSLCEKLNTGYKRKNKLNINEWYLNQCMSPTDL